MKKYNYLMLFFICFLFACKDEERDYVKPDPLTTYTVTPINGGAMITYSIPGNANILYVEAEYERNGIHYTERSSIYKNQVTIEGFNTSKEVQSTLYTVNRSGIRSEPVTVAFVPLEAPVRLAYQSLKLVTGFGGVVASWENLSKTELGIRLMVEENGALESKNMYFSANPSELYAFRGFDDTEKTFAVCIEDKWGNISDTLSLTTTPYFETEVPKPFGDLRKTIPYDNPTENPTFIWPRMHNNRTGDDSWLTLNDDRYGSSFTMDLKQVYKLSRLSIWPRMRPNTPTDVYTVNNVLAFEMWGSKSIDPTRLPPADLGYWLEAFTESSFQHPGVTRPAHTFADDWVYLGRYEIERLDLQGASATDIANRAIEGNHFDVPIDAEPVRYVRFFVLATDKGSPSPGSCFQIGELSFFGDNKVSQN
ncbi:MAG: DUF4959 domain-containing protein, partial [Mangrovibacterium sp.]|nr:DUF4959 domain-containing protein [Mangrovibacterium sp.]